MLIIVLSESYIAIFLQENLIKLYVTLSRIPKQSCVKYLKRKNPRSPSRCEGRNNRARKSAFKASNFLFTTSQAANKKSVPSLTHVTCNNLLLAVSEKGVVDCNAIEGNFLRCRVLYSNAKRQRVRDAGEAVSK